jgi:hypothetical protein
MEQENYSDKLPASIKNIQLFLKRKNISGKVIYIVISVLATMWVLIRVVPKPSRATYPCMITLSPIVTGFVIWLLSVTGSLVAFRKAKQLIIKNKYLAAVGLILVGLTFTIILFINNPQILRANVDTWYKPNMPIGKARGIFPGRVVWTHNPKAAKWDGKTGFWWEEQYTNQSESNRLLNEALLKITGTKNEKQSWNAIFRYFNKTHKGLDQAYKTNEKIVIKINMNNNSSHENNNEINTSPQIVFSTLSSLINQANVLQENITVTDASRFITNSVFEKCHSAFPGVIFVDNAGEDGRVKSTYQKDAIPYSTDNHLLARDLVSCMSEASYVINIAILKGHVGQGVTLCAKNWYGTTSINSDWRKNAHDNFGQNRNGSPKYMTFTDYMGHKDLGEKTILFMLDALYTNKFVGGKPEYKWHMAPFNNNWPSSLLISQDGVAIDAVGMDFILAEWPDAPDLKYCDAYLIESALADKPLSGTFYDPERDGTGLKSLGVMEHWNNPVEKKYSRNLKSGDGIELVYSLIK